MHHIATAFVGRLRVIGLAVASLVLLLPNGVAEARQIVESICSASETRGFDASSSTSVPWFGEWPRLGEIAPGAQHAIEEACGPVFARGSLVWTGASFEYEFDSSVNFLAEFAFLLQAGADGVALRVSSGTWIYLVRKGNFEFLPSGSLIELSPFEEIECFSDGRCSLIAKSGEIASVIGLYGYWEASVTGASWTCSGTKPWEIGPGDLSCEGEGDSSCNPSGGWFGIESDSNSIEAFLGPGPSPDEMDVRCEFLLETACCVRYRQQGGIYCDSLPLIDGAMLPLPPIPGAPCFESAGAVVLAAGWHIVEIFASDLGDGSFSLEFTPGDCGPDCDGNGRPDVVDIEWAAKYEGLDLDSDFDGTLDSCERAEGDLDLDGWIGPLDLALLLADWGSFGLGDVDGDGTVGAGDLRILLGNWRVPE
jgi:hypothetical protein